MYSVSQSGATAGMVGVSPAMAAARSSTCRRTPAWPAPPVPRRRRRLRVDHQGLDGIADRGALGLGIEQNRHGHCRDPRIHRGRCAHCPHRSDDRDLGGGTTRWISSRPAARDQHVDLAAGTHHRVGALAPVGIDRGDGIGGQPTDSRASRISPSSALFDSAAASRRAAAPRCRSSMPARQCRP